MIMYSYITRQIKKQLTALIEFYENSKGNPATTVTIQSAADAASYTATTSAGYQIKIICQEVVYSVRFTRQWGWFNKKHRAFRVYCDCCPGTPEHIRKHLQVEHTFPDLTQRWTSVRYKKKAAIFAYLNHLAQHTSALGQQPC